MLHSAYRLTSIDILSTKVGASIQESHHKKQLIQPRHKRQNHSSTASLLEVPRYPDLLEDQDNDDESERGRALVMGAAGWQTEMAGWICAA